jgi:hypothetical protein
MIGRCGFNEGKYQSIFLLNIQKEIFLVANFKMFKVTNFSPKIFTSIPQLQCGWKILERYLFFI